VPDHIRRSNNAAGICLIAVIFLVETSVLEHRDPRPQTPYVLAVLAVVALAALVASIRLRLAGRK
jgi:hypothetical protein